MRDDRAGAQARRRLGPLLVLAAIAVAWEGTKALFAIPSYQLPHLYEILGDFLREGAGGERWYLIMAVKIRGEPRFFELVTAVRESLRADPALAAGASPVREGA